MSYFSEKLRSLRALNGLTQDQFAQKLGLSRSAVGMYETAEREPDFETLEKISSILNVDSGTLLGDSKFDKNLHELLIGYQKLNVAGQNKAHKLLAELLTDSQYTEN